MPRFAEIATAALGTAVEPEVAVVELDERVVELDSGLAAADAYSVSSDTTEAV